MGDIIEDRAVCSVGRVEKVLAGNRERGPN